MHATNFLDSILPTMSAPRAPIRQMTQAERDDQCVSILLDYEGSMQSRKEAEALVALMKKRAADLDAEIELRRAKNPDYPRGSPKPSVKGVLKSMGV